MSGHHLKLVALHAINPVVESQCTVTPLVLTRPVQQSVIRNFCDCVQFHKIANTNGGNDSTVIFSSVKLERLIGARRFTLLMEPGGWSIGRHNKCSHIRTNE